MRADRRWQVIAALALLCVGIWCSAWVGSRDELSFTFFDVGKGLCVIGRTPSGRIIVFDCGTSSWRRSDLAGERLVVPYLRKTGAGRIDIAVLSHPHLDHFSGFAGLFDAAPPRLVLLNVAKNDLPEYREFREAVRESRARCKTARRGQSIEMPDGVRISVLHSGAKNACEDLNECSIVLRVCYRNVSILLCGDAGEAAEEQILNSRIPVQAGVMQVGHHGSETACSPRWLAAVRPEVAVISCGDPPSRVTLDRLESAGARVLRTDLHGAVTVTTDGTSVTCRVFKHPIQAQ